MESDVVHVVLLVRVPFFLVFFFFGMNGMRLWAVMVVCMVGRMARDSVFTTLCYRISGL